MRVRDISRQLKSKLKSTMKKKKRKARKHPNQSRAIASLRTTGYMKDLHSDH